MYTYLDARSEPTINEAYQRSIKLLLVLLTPCAVPLVVLAGPLLELFFGDGFDAASGALQVLGPTVVLLGIVLLSMSLMSSRLKPRLLVVYYGIALAVNVVANLALIPTLEATGAALGMLISEVVLAFLTMRACLKEVGAIAVPATIGGPLLAGLAMAGALLALQSLLLVALAVGVVVYFAALAAVDRLLAPADVRFVADAVRQRIPRRGRLVHDSGGAPTSPDGGSRADRPGPE
jgi:O-antigen/teichoic acid export membrane protein